MLVGCVLMSGILGGVKWNAVGLLLGILAGVSYAAYNILTKISMRSGLDPITVTLYSFGFMALISLFLLKPISFAGIVSANASATIPLLLGLGVVTFVVPYFLYTLAIKVLPAGTCASLSIVEPMAASVISILFFDERLNVFSTFGICFVLFAVVLIGRETEKES